MTSIILQTLARLLEPIMLFYAIILLISGHDQPGGGFSGGLTAAGAFVLHVIAFDQRSARRMLVATPQLLLGLGLLVAIGSGIPSLLTGSPFMTGRWTKWDVPGIGTIKIGTPLIFDIGVFLVVVGMVALIVTALTEMQESDSSTPATTLGDGRKES